MVKKTRKYTNEFKQEAVNLALKSATINQAATSLGIPAGTLYAWIEQTKDNKSATLKSTQSSDTQIDIGKLVEENRRLHKELAITKEEKEILKKATQYFAQNQK